MSRSLKVGDCLLRQLGTHKVTPDVAARTWELLSDPKFGLARDGAFDMQGFRNVLALRAEIEGSWGGKPPAPDRYVDLSYYDKALKRVSP